MLSKLILLLSFSLFTISACIGQSITVMIDAGHGGSDPGNIAENASIKQEKDLNLAIAKKVGSYLTTKLENVTVIYTRTEDKFISLDDRVALANSKKVDYFISIHCNSAKNKSISGTECHVNSKKSTKAMKLAKIFEDEFKKKVGRKSRGIKDAKDLEHSLQVLKYTEMTSVLIECGFMSNVKEAQFLNSLNGQELIASAIFRGIRTFLTEEHKSISFTAKNETDNNASKETKNDEKSKKYTIQIYSSVEWKDTEKGSFKNLSNSVSRKDNPKKKYRYTYYSGEFKSKSEAEEYLKEVKQKGFPDAIIIQK